MTHDYINTVKPVNGAYNIKRVLNQENIDKKKVLDKKLTKTKDSSSSSKTETLDLGDVKSYGVNTIGAIASGKKSDSNTQLTKIIKLLKTENGTYTSENGLIKDKSVYSEDLSTNVKFQEDPLDLKFLRPNQGSSKIGILEVYETDMENFTPYTSTPEDQDKTSETETTTNEDESETTSTDEDNLTYHQGEILSTSYYPFNYTYTYDTDYTEGTSESKVDSYIFTDEDLNYIYKGVQVLLKLGWLQFGENLPSNDKDLKKIKADITFNVTARITKLYKQKWASQEKAYNENKKNETEFSTTSTNTSLNN